LGSLYRLLIAIDQVYPAEEPTAFPFAFNALEKENIQAGLDNMILVPFRTTWICLSGEKGLWMGFENIAGNLLGFAPMGFLLPVLFVSLNNGKKVIATVFAISLSLELTQLLTGVGYFDIDDLIQNTLGGLIGYWLYKKWLAKGIFINRAT
jgi:glycopeptide antibiotics resistance protein